jgi:hypothetical protein
MERPLCAAKRTYAEAVRPEKCRYRKSVDFSITSSVHFPAKASRVYKQEACEMLVQPQYGTDRIFGRLFLG